jgi:hypothetical protein
LLTIIGVLSGGILLVVLIFSVNRRFRAPASPRLEGKSPRSERQKRATLGTGLRQHPAEAFLDPESPQILRISLTGIDLILGSDASLTPTPLEDPSVSGMHARIIRLANGKYKIQDLDSDAGTWINYHQVEPKGQILQHNDLIHLGRVAYRFHYAEPPAPRQIHIQPMAKDNEQPAASEPADENDST